MTKGMIDQNTQSRTRCPVCDNFILPHMDLCNPCQELKDKLAEMRRQRKRDEAFGSIWDEAFKRRSKW